MYIILFIVSVYILTCTISEQLVPKDTSYGYVPRESQITKYPNEVQNKWRPFVARDYQRAKTIASDLITNHGPLNQNLTNTISKNVSLINSDDKKNDLIPESRSLKSLRSPGGSYYYEPPPPSYLPPSNDPIPTDYTTIGPTDEEFFNVPPSQDEIPQDIPGTQGYEYPRPNTPLNDLQPPFAQDDPFPISPSSQYLPIPSADIPQTPDLSSSYSPYGVGVTIAKGVLAKNVPNKSSHAVFDDGLFLDGRQPKNREALQIEVTEMHCFNTPTDGRFQAVLTVKSTNENIPVFDDVFQSEISSCTVRSETSPPRLNTKLHINIPKSQFGKCFVRECSAGGDVVHLCVKLRFPTIVKMKLAEDPVLTLQCRTQDRIVAHTKHLQLDVDNSASSRSGAVARGGGRGGLRSRVGLYRKSTRGDYTEALPPRARVILGELLMLRADVEPDEGWAASRLSSVSLAGGVGNAKGGFPLLGADGCRALRARALCPREPRVSPPLGHTLLIRAAMFDGMRSGEEVRLSIRLTACLEASDCKTPKCSGDPVSRIRRDDHQKNHTHTVNATSELSFTVVLPDEDAEGSLSQEPERRYGPLFAMLIVLSATIACSVALMFLKTKGRMCGGEGRTR